MAQRILLLLLWLAGGSLAHGAGSGKVDWPQVIALDAGPGTQFRTREEARTAATAHLDRQEKLLRQYLSDHPQDEHAFEARLRLARLLQIRATFQNQENVRAEATHLLDEADQIATGTQRAEVDFARISLLMRTLRPENSAQRERLLLAARRFQAENPADRRVPALLAEVATLFDLEPDTQRGLLLDAQKGATDPGLKDQLADDLKRIGLLGQPIALRTVTRRGHALDLADYHGKVVVLIFCAEFSPACAEAITQLQRVSASWSKASVQVVAISLDSKPEDLATLTARTNLVWPVGFDGKGWLSAPVRALGINRLPTVWLLDRDGKLRSLNGLSNTAQQVRDLLKESSAN